MFSALRNLYRSRKRCLKLLIVLASIFAFLQPHVINAQILPILLTQMNQAIQEWPQPGRTGQRLAATSELILPPLTPRWTVTFPSGGLTDYGPITIAVHDKIFVVLRSGDSTRSLVALDAETGSEVWSKGFVDNRSFDYVGYDETTDRLYASTATDVFVFNPETGNILNQYPVPVWCGWTRFAIVDGNLYLVACARLSRIDENGNVLWTNTDPYFPNGGFGTPTVYDGIVYVGSNSWTIQAIDANTGQMIWQAPTNGGPYTAPIAADGLIMVGCQGQGSGSQTVLAWDAHTGQPKWGVVTGYGGTIDTPMSYYDGVLYFGSADQTVYAIDTRAPRMLWATETPSDIASPVVYMGGLVYAISGGTLRAFDSQTGEAVYEQNVDGWGNLVPYKGMLIMSRRDWLQSLDSHPGIRLKVNPPFQIAIPGEQTRLYLDLQSTYNFTETLQISSSNTPDGISIDIAPLAGVGSQRITTTVTLSPTISTSGFISLTFTASSTSTLQMTTAVLFVAKSRIFLPWITK